MMIASASPIGITPAHAGKSRWMPGTWQCSGDHPRTCGEKQTVQGLWWAIKGSPPHMRGKVPPQTGQIFAIRITPAHAGKSPVRRAPYRKHRDHPRTCGEKASDTHTDCKASGSPPHMRGKGALLMAGCNKQGITPAHAGKSSVTVRSSGASEDHPRTCGEKISWQRHTSSASGSPPHMRGKDVPYLRPQAQCGITPAHAGKSLNRS